MSFRRIKRLLDDINISFPSAKRKSLDNIPMIYHQGIRIGIGTYVPAQPIPTPVSTPAHTHAHVIALLAQLWRKSVHVYMCHRTRVPKRFETC